MPEHSRDRGTRRLTDDSVPGVVELRYAGRLGPGQREVLPDQSGRDVCVADESLPGGDPGGRG
jgi:hypothetical protein